MKLLILALLASQGAFAREVKFNRRVDLTGLEADLKSQGFAVKHILCAGSSCSITMPDSETKDPMPIVNAQPAPLTNEEIDAQRRARLQAVKELVGKLRAGTATQAERDQLLAMLVRVVLDK